MDAASILKILRAKTGMSWEYMAEQLGIPGGKHGSYQKISQARNISTDFMFQVCNLFGYEIVVRPRLRKGDFAEYVLDDNPAFDTTKEERRRLAEVKQANRGTHKVRKVSIVVESPSQLPTFDEAQKQSLADLSNAPTLPANSSGAQADNEPGEATTPHPGKATW